MPIPVVNPPNITAQAVTQAMTQVQAFASSPMTARAVDPTHKKEKTSESRTNRDRSRGGDRGASADPEGIRGHIVNTSA